MSVKVVDETFNQEVWNAVAPHPMVSWKWGEARQKMGKKVLRVIESSDSFQNNVFQITFHPIPHTPYSVAYMPRTVIPSIEVLKVLRDEAKKAGAIFIKIEPYARKTDKNEEDFFKLVRKSPHGLFPEWTQILDLQKTEDQLLEAMKPKWRYNIRLAQKKGVEVKEMTSDEGFEIFSDLYFQTTNRQSYHGHDKNYHKVIFETLQRSIGHILIAFYEGIPLSAYHLFLFNNVLYYPYGGSSEQHKSVMASNLLMWEAIRFGLKNNAKVFDMWGSLPPTYAEDASGWAGFTRFKEGFGTEFVEFVGSFDYVIQPKLYTLYNAAYAVRKKIL